MNNFKFFLLNEEKTYFGHKVGDVLTSLQDLNNDIENLGSRQLARLAEEIVNQIRKILHDSWSPKHVGHLQQLQKIGVALQKTIEDRGDLREMLPAAANSLQDLMTKLGVKTNNLEAPEIPGEDVSMDDFQSTPMPQQENPQQMGQNPMNPDPMSSMQPQQNPMTPNPSGQNNTGMF